MTETETPEPSFDPSCNPQINPEIVSPGLSESRVVTKLQLNVKALDGVAVNANNTAARSTGTNFTARDLDIISPPLTRIV